MEVNNIKIYLVTGGTGLFGRAIQKEIEKNRLENEEWYFVSSRDVNLLNYNETYQLFERIRPTHVLHLAAKVGGLFSNMQSKVEFFRENIIMNDNVMECSRLFNIIKLISCMSTCIFPDKTDYPINETMIHKGEPHYSNMGYAYAKRMVDIMNHCYAEEYNCLYTSIIPTNIYGPEDNFDIMEGHVIPSLIHKCYLARENREPFIIYGSGTPVRQFIFSEDLARITCWLLRNYTDIEPIIVSVDETDEISIREIAEIIAEEMGMIDNIIFDTTKSDGQIKKTASNDKLRKLLPNIEFTPIREGIRKTIEWFEINYNNVRK